MGLKEEFEKAFVSKFRPITQNDPALINYTEGAKKGAEWALRWAIERCAKEFDGRGAHYDIEAKMLRTLSESMES